MSCRTSIAFICLLLASVHSFAFLGLGETSWKEEALLHDGTKILVLRSQSYGGNHEIGQPPPVKEHRFSFEVPGSSTTVQWASEFVSEIGRTNFNVLAVHVIGGIPYLVTEPNLCLSYNKWGRPNPPYVAFKYEGKEWKRISLRDLPSEFKTINVIVNVGREKDIEAAARKTGYVPAESVMKINSSLRQPEYRAILREPIPLNTSASNVNCDELIYYKGAWVGPGDSIGRRMMDAKTR